MSEFDLITRYFSRPSTRTDVVLGVGDDAAVLDVPAGQRLVAAVDTIVEGVHFPKGTDPAAIGYRALAVNLSDMAAMGAQPAWMTLSLSLPVRDEAWLAGFSSGLYRLADAQNVALVGGDTVRGPLSITVQILGLVEKDRWLTRDGAKPGDILFVSGVPGEAAAGLAVLQRSLPASTHADHLLHCFLWPEPRVQLGRGLRSVASAAIDVSDGLIADLGHIAAKSRCAAQVDLSALPASSSMRALFNERECERMSLAGGDDYELLFTVPAKDAASITSLPSLGDVRVTAIGRIVAGEGVVCLRGGQPVAIEQQGYDHFA
ncbi:MAG TPA: thiamine-phosphate kinase [Steroidobacteraceae bacterium]|nr:thiamine-phosphate kinase [Steroidobacteraceae bacterium]